MYGSDELGTGCVHHFNVNIFFSKTLTLLSNRLVKLERQTFALSNALPF